MDLVKYDTACRLLEEARSVDEVRQIRDVAIALRVYARQAKNKTLEANAWEIRVRAERRVGEMMENGKDQRAPSGGRLHENPLPTLAENGIGKGLAHRARKLFKLTEKAFGLFLIDGRANVEHAVERTIGRTECGQNRTTPMTECPKCGHRWHRG